MNLQSWLQLASNTLAETSDSPALDAALLAEQHTGLSRSQQRIHNPELTSKQLQALHHDLNRRQHGEPIAYILGRQPFYDITLRVTPATLIPRPDTEHLLETALEKIPENAAIAAADLGTGSGALAIAIGKHRPAADIIAIDCSIKALRIAAENAALNHVSNVHFLQSDWLAACRPQSLHIIVSNPPYIDPDDPHLAALRYEPITALTAADAGFADLHRIIQQAETALRPQGWLLLEHGYTQAAALRQFAAKRGVWRNIATRKDYGGNDRVTLMQYSP